MEELKKNWRLNWLSALVYVASIKDQKQHWLDPGQSNPHWSFVEIMCEYFDDLDSNEGYDKYILNGFVTDKEVMITSKFHKQFDIYVPPKKDEYDHRAILNDPNWMAVCREARRTCKKLLSVLSDPTERNLIYKIN